MSDHRRMALMSLASALIGAAAIDASRAKVIVVGDEPLPEPGMPKRAKSPRTASAPATFEIETRQIRRARERAARKGRTE